MKTNLVRIGNSRGIRIPKPIIEQCRLDDNVELRIEDNRLIISSERAPRDGWDSAFRAAASKNDELLLRSVAPNKFDREEWKW